MGLGTLTLVLRPIKQSLIFVIVFQYSVGIFQKGEHVGDGYLKDLFRGREGIILPMKKRCKTLKEIFIALYPFMKTNTCLDKYPPHAWGECSEEESCSPFWFAMPTKKRNLGTCKVILYSYKYSSVEYIF